MGGAYCRNSGAIFVVNGALWANPYLGTGVIKYYEIPSFMEKDLIDPYSGGAWLWLVQIAIPGQTTQRIARNTADIVYGGDDFPKGNFDPPKQSSSGDGSVPKVVLSVAQDRDSVLENIINATKGGTNGIVKIIRTCEKFLTSPVAELEADFDILTAGSNTEWVIFSLGMPDPLIQRIPLWLYSSKVCPYATPSLFKGVRCQYIGAYPTCTGLLEDCFTKGNIVHWGAEVGLDPNAVRVYHVSSNNFNRIVLGCGKAGNYSCFLLWISLPGR